MATGLDDIDHAIVRVLGRNCRLPATKVAEELNLKPGRVAARIQSMCDRDSIRFSVQRNLRAYGYGAYGILDITLSGTGSDRAIEDVCALPNVIVVAEGLGAPHLYVFVVGRSQAEITNFVMTDIAKIRNIQSCQVYPVLDVVQYSGEIAAIQQRSEFWSPATEHDLDEVIIDMLQKDARLSNVELSRQLNLSEAAIRQRINRLVEDNRIRFGLLVEQKLLTVNIVRVNVGVIPSQVQNVAARIGKIAPWVMITGGEFQISVALQGPDVDELCRILRDDIQKMPGVLRTAAQTLVRAVKHNFNCIILPEQ